MNMKTRATARLRSLPAAVAVGALAVAAPFVAAAPAAASPTGAVSFYTTTSYTGLVRSAYYLNCATTQVIQLRQVTGSYDNRPAPGCRVQVAVSGSAWYTLCSGRHVLPPAYRTAPTVRIAAGYTPQDCINP
jgi:hypothetical protein